MATTAELLHAYQQQAGIDADEAVGLLLDFLASYGMTGNVTDVLCDHIDEEGMTGDFAQLLVDNGLVIEALDEDDVE